jgi:hypothetical protein
MEHVGKMIASVPQMRRSFLKASFLSGQNDLYIRVVV